MKTNLFLALLLCVMLLRSVASAQKLPPVTIDAGLTNATIYLPDTADYSRFGTQLGPVAAMPPANGLYEPFSSAKNRRMASPSAVPTVGPLIKERIKLASPTRFTFISQRGLS